MALFEVFGRRKPSDPLVHVGQVHADGVEAALLLVRETHFRHEEGVEFAVVATEHLHVLPDPSLLDHQVDQSYRQNHGFTPFGPKRQQARDRAEERGRGDLRRRPVPGKPAGVSEGER